METLVTNRGLEELLVPFFAFINCFEQKGQNNE